MGHDTLFHLALHVLKGIGTSFRQILAMKGSKVTDKAYLIYTPGLGITWL